MEFDLVTDQKAFERSVRAVWDEIRKERRAGRRNVTSAELTASAARMRDFAERFDALAAEAKQAEAAAPLAAADGDEAKNKPRRKPKAKKAANPKSAKKARKKKT